jgi:hypothetical protein
VEEVAQTRGWIPENRYPFPRLSPGSDGFLRGDGAHGVDDVAGGDTESVEKFGWFAASRNFAHCQPMHDNAGISDCARDGVADSACRVMIFYGNQTAAGRAPGAEQRVTIDW